MAAVTLVERQQESNFLGKLLSTADTLEGVESVFKWTANNGYAVAAPWKDPTACRHYIISTLQSFPHHTQDMVVSFTMALPFLNNRSKFSYVSAAREICKLLSAAGSLLRREELIELEEMATAMEQEGTIAMVTNLTQQMLNRILDTRMAFFKERRDRTARRNALEYCRQMSVPLWWLLATITAARTGSLRAAMQMALLERFGMLDVFPIGYVRERMPFFLFAASLPLEEITAFLKQRVRLPVVKITRISDWPGAGDAAGLFQAEALSPPRLVVTSPKRPELVGYRVAEDERGTTVTLERLKLVYRNPGRILFHQVVDRIMSGRYHSFDDDTKADALAWALLNVDSSTSHKKMHLLLSTALSLLAAHPECPEWILKALSASRFSTARAVAALRNPDASPEELLHVVSRQRGGIYWLLAAVLTHPNCPVELKMSIIMHHGASRLKRNWPHVARAIGL